MILFRVFDYLLFKASDKIFGEHLVLFPMLERAGAKLFQSLHVFVEISKLSYYESSLFKFGMRSYLTLFSIPSDKLSN